MITRVGLLFAVLAIVVGMGYSQELKVLEVPSDGNLENRQIWKPEQALHRAPQWITAR
jgi:hypothetical protein